MMLGTTTMYPRYVATHLFYSQHQHFLQGKIKVDSIDDKEDMQFADEAFDILGFSEEEKFDVYKVGRQVDRPGNHHKVQFWHGVDMRALFGQTAHMSSGLAFREESAFYLWHLGTLPLTNGLRDFSIPDQINTNTF